MINFWDIIKSLVPIIVVLGILYGVLKYVKKYYNPVKGINVSNFQVKVLATHAIMPRKYVSILKIKDKIFIVGIADNSISLLKEMDVEEADIDNSGSIVEKNSFVDLLRKNLSLK